MMDIAYWQTIIILIQKHNIHGIYMAYIYQVQVIYISVGSPWRTGIPLWKLCSDGSKKWKGAGCVSVEFSHVFTSKIAISTRYEWEFQDPPRPSKPFLVHHQHHRDQRQKLRVMVKITRICNNHSVVPTANDNKHGGYHRYHRYHQYHQYHYWYRHRYHHRYHHHNINQIINHHHPPRKAYFCPLAQEKQHRSDP